MTIPLLKSSRVDLVSKVDQERYLEAHMNGVSRSFAVVIASLQQPLRNQLALSYLLCRVADNIEDCTQSTAWKSDRFEEFGGLLAEPERAAETLAVWDGVSWPGLTDDERALMGGGGAELWRIYAALPLTEREIIRQWVWTMAEGMTHLDEANIEPRFLDVGGLRVLARPADYNQYCYIVAGTVGHMATELVIHRYGVGGPQRQRLLDASEACGRALQKTNILKDFAEDLTRGVCYLPDEWLELTDRSPLAFDGASPAFKQVVVEDILADLQVATEYMLDLPTEASDYRLAGLLCLLPALQTDLLAVQRSDRLFTVNHPYKITRMTLGKCMFDARRMVSDNAQIAAYSHELQAEILRHLHT